MVAVRKALGERTVCIGTDINHHMGPATRECASLNETDVQLILTDLCSAIEDRLRQAIDLLIFNPPYVPTPREEVVDSSGDEASIASSWAGGRDGMQVTRRFVQKIPDLLSDAGVFYLVLLQDNDVPGVLEEMSSLGLEARVALTRRCGRETLSVVSGRRRRK